MHLEKPSAGSMRAFDVLTFSVTIVSRRWALALTTCLLVFTLDGMRSELVDAHQAAGAVVDDGRPVAKAMALLFRHLGWNITYEEPVLVNGDDLYVLRNGGRQGTYPRRGQVRLPDEAGMATARDNPAAFLESVIATEERSRGRVKRFKVLRSESMFHVVPDSVREPQRRRSIYRSRGVITLTDRRLIHRSPHRC